MFETRIIGNFDFTHYRDNDLGISYDNDEHFLEKNDVIKLRDLLNRWYPERG